MSAQEARAKAWITRRAKYGSKGHNGYFIAKVVAKSRASRVLEELDRAYRQIQMLLPEESAYKALDRILEAEELLKGKTRE